MNQTAISELGMLPALQGSPTIDINRHTLLALRGGRSAPSIVTEALRLIRGPGKLNISEYVLCQDRHKTYYVDQPVMRS